MVSAEGSTDVRDGTAAMGSNRLQHVKERPGSQAMQGWYRPAVGTLRGKGVGAVSAGVHIDVSTITAVMCSSMVRLVSTGEPGYETMQVWCRPAGSKQHLPMYSSPRPWETKDVVSVAAAMEATVKGMS